MKTPREVAAALKHVRTFFPEVVQVFFGIDGRWLYTDGDMVAPEFGGKIDVGILEDAADSLDSLPAAFAIDCEGAGLLDSEGRATGTIA